MPTPNLVSRREPTIRPVVFAPFGRPIASVESSDLPPVPDPVEAIEQARQEAETAGYAEGYRRGQLDGERAYREQAARLASLVTGAAQNVHGALLQLEPEIVELAFTIARRIVERELTINPDLVVDTVRTALLAIDQLIVVRVRVHPDDYDLVAQAWSSLAPGTKDASAELVADPKVQQGGCIVDTTSGFVDAQHQTQLDEIGKQLLSMIGGEE
jgi:flagellar assembly protein FliH